MSLEPGQTLLHYRVTAELGRGGMGLVYRAVDTRLGREVALKVLPAEWTADPSHLARFRREARALAALDHPGIVTVHSVEEADGIPFLTMALVEGTTLDRTIPSGGLDVPRLLEIAVALADALVAAHGKGVIHRDLKPGNVIVDERGRVRILDFGLARISTPQAGPDDPTRSLDPTREGVVVGTIPYMSPEQLQGRKVDSRSDLFSLGVLLYEAAVGRRPFAGTNNAAIISSILRDEPVPVSRIRTDLPPGLDGILGRCLAKDPESRFASAESLRDALAALRPAATAQAEKKIASIAVLPLANLSGNPAEEYFADGMTEALITDLAKVGDLKVISRTSVMKFKGVARAIGEIARELGVDAIVEGTILRAGDRVRISAQLIRAATDEHLWAERYDRNLEDVLALQDEVARAIVRQVDATLKGPSSGEREVPRKVDPEVYRLVLQGRHYWNLRTEGAFHAALTCFREAIDRDATWSPAWVGVAESLNMLSNYGFQPPGEVRPKAVAAAHRALELDEHSADAHRVLATIRWQCEFDWSGAIEAYERSLELDPVSSLTTYWYGAFLGVIGDFAGAHRMLDRAAESDPLSLLIPSVKGWIHIFARRFSDAIPFQRRVIAIDPNYHLARWFLGEALVEIGEHEAGISELERALELSGRSSRLLGYLGYAHGRAGREADARQILEKLDAREASGYVPPYFFALVHAGLGEADRALDRLEQAYAGRDTMLRDLKADPHWDRLRELPRFRELFAKMAYPRFP